MERDLEHLKLLSIFHYIAAGMIALVGCFPIVHLAVGILVLAGGHGMFADRFPAGPTGEDKLVGVVFTVVGAVGILGGWTLAFVVALAGRYLARQTHYTFCMVVAGLACLCVPPGTVLGVCTIMVLIRPSVKELFDLHAQVESTTS